MISIIICSVDPAKFDAVRASYAEHFGDEPFEIIGIHDARSLCEGYNRGLHRAQGDLCVFSHDDIEILSPDLGALLRRHLTTFDVIGVAGTTRLAGMGWASSGIRFARGMVTHRVNGDYVVQLFGVREPVCEGIVALDGVFFAARRGVAERIGFDEQTFDGWHGYDTDFVFRCYLDGFRIAVCPAIELIHFSTGKTDLAWLKYEKRFAAKHAGRMSAGAGVWLDVTRRVRTRDEVRACYRDLAQLRELTDELARQADASPQ
jgi:GT2 family glycosyltransferase